MTDFINFYFIPALSIGSVYALGAVGISMIFGILRFAHFAHGDLMTVGAYGVLAAVPFIPVPPLLLLPFGIALAIIMTSASNKRVKPLPDRAHGTATT